MGRHPCLRPSQPTDHITFNKPISVRCPGAGDMGSRDLPQVRRCFSTPYTQTKACLAPQYPSRVPGHASPIIPSSPSHGTSDRSTQLWMRQHDIFGGEDLESVLPCACGSPGLFRYSESWAVQICNVVEHPRYMIVHARRSLTYPFYHIGFVKHFGSSRVDSILPRHAHALHI